MNPAIKDIGSQLQAAREHRGLTQRVFANKAGATQARISKIETGDVDPRISTLVELARNLDLELMLIPRQHVPAVRAIISKQPLSYEEKSLRTALSRLQSLGSRLSQSFPDNAHLRKLTRITRELSNLKLRPADLAPIKKATETLVRIEQTPALIGAVKAPIEDLNDLRNTRAHDISEAPSTRRPAYRLGEEDGR